MIAQKTVTIGEEAFRIESLPSTQALSLLAELAGIASGLGMGIKDLPSSMDEVNEALAKTIDLGAMVQGLFAKIDPVKTPALIKRIIRDSLPIWNDKPGFDDWYDDRFSRGVHDLMALLYAIFDWNYGDPLEWVKKTVAKLPKTALAWESGREEQSTPS